MAGALQVPGAGRGPSRPGGHPRAPQWRSGQVRAQAAAHLCAHLPPQVCVQAASWPVRVLCRHLQWAPRQAHLRPPPLTAGTGEAPRPPPGAGWSFPSPSGGRRPGACTWVWPRAADTGLANLSTVQVGSPGPPPPTPHEGTTESQLGWGARPSQGNRDRLPVRGWAWGWARPAQGAETRGCRGRGRPGQGHA